MKAFEIMNDIIGLDFLCEHKDSTVDTLKIGNADKNVKKIAVCFIATPDVIKQAGLWGADLLITHEPSFYNHHDNIEDVIPTKQKLQLLEESNMTVYRYHDSMHFNGEDLIDKAFLEKLGWAGYHNEENGFLLTNEKSPIELVREIQDVLDIRHTKIIGRRDGKVKKIYLALGARGSKPYTKFRENDYHVIIAGELCEWYDCEPIRDMAQMGYQKTIIILGHVGSEREGMKTLAKNIDGRYDNAEAKYFECEELYTYVD